MAATAARKPPPAPTKPSRRRKTLPATPTGDAVTTARLGFAVAELERSGALAGARSKKLSLRVDPGLIEAARRRTGLRGDADLVNAALAMLAAGDDFGPWLVRQAGRLPEDFEFAL